MARSRPTTVDLGGTIRAEAADVTLARLRPLLRTLGITRVGNVTGLDHVGVPMWQVVRPLARSLTVSQGKGLTDALAQASGIMESIELHHAEHFTPRGHRRSLRAAARESRYADPLLLPVRANARVEDGAATDWIEGVDLLSGAAMYAPRDCIDLDSVSKRTQPRLFVASSNGLASGNTKAEAILHALCEVIERDQTSLWQARRRLLQSEPPVHITAGSVTDESCRWLLGKCRDAGLGVVLSSVSSDIPVPCFICEVFDHRGETLYPQRASGYGCHPYRRVALARAITEALQSRLAHIAGGRDDMFWSYYRDVLPADNDRGRAWAKALEAEAGYARFDDVAEAPALPTIEEMLQWTLTSVRSAGFSQVIVVDLTQENIGIPVVHVTVPGLEGMIGESDYTPGPRMQSLLKERLSS